MFRGDTSQLRRVKIYNHSIKSGLVNAKVHLLSYKRASRPHDQWSLHGWFVLEHDFFFLGDMLLFRGEVSAFHLFQFHCESSGTAISWLMMLVGAVCNTAIFLDTFLFVAISRWCNQKNILWCMLHLKWNDYNCWFLHQSAQSTPGNNRGLIDDCEPPHVPFITPQCYRKHPQNKVMYVTSSNIAMAVKRPFFSSNQFLRLLIM